MWKKGKAELSNLFCWGLHAILDPFGNYWNNSRAPEGIKVATGTIWWATISFFQKIINSLGQYLLKIIINGKTDDFGFIFESSIAKITKSLDGYNLKTDLYQVWVYLLKEVKKEAKIISLAIDYNFEQVLIKAVYDFLEKRNGSSSNGAGSYLNSFWSSAIVSVISKWVKDGMKTPAEKIAKLGLPLFPQKRK